MRTCSMTKHVRRSTCHHGAASLFVWKNRGLAVSPLVAMLASASTVLPEDQFDNELWLAGFPRATLPMLVATAALIGNS
jgi:hypothetical protein